jgi:hypothetical protein
MFQRDGNLYITLLFPVSRDLQEIITVQGVISLELF